MGTNRTTYKNSPLLETGVGIQFTPVPSLRTTLLFEFWSTYLKEEFPEIDEVPAVPQFQEEIGDHPPFGLAVPSPSFLLRLDPSVRIRAKNDGLMVQVQNGWLVLNWVGGNPGYPRFDSMREKFLSYWKQWCDFIVAKKVPSLTPNLWEIIYTNQIFQDENTWRTRPEIPAVFPGLLAANPFGEIATLEDVQAKWAGILPGKIGRLYADVHQGIMLQSPRPVLILQLIARGKARNMEEVETGWEAGHASALKFFQAVTSQQAQRFWQLEG